MKKRYWLVGGLVVVLGGAGLSGIAGGGGDGSIPVRLGQVERRDLVASVTASGQLEPTRSVDVSSDITGRIVELTVEEGDEVTRGQLLLRIDPTQFQAAVRRAEAAVAGARAAQLQMNANLQQARRALDRARELRQTNESLVSDEQMETAETNFEVAQANANAQEHQVDQAIASLEEAQDQLSKTTITAPMSGKVTRVAVEEGEVALASTFNRDTGLLVTISDLSAIQVNVQVDETDVVRLALNDSAEIEIDAFPDSTYSGRVTKISQSAIQAAASGTNDQAVDFDVEITMDNPPVGVRPDLSATARIVTDIENQVPSIPIIALTVRSHSPISSEVASADTTARETEGVFVIENGVAQFRPVRVGIAGDEFFQVLSGLADGDSIVAGPYQVIKDLRDSAIVRGMRDQSTESN